MNATRLTNVFAWIALLCGVAAVVWFLLGWSTQQSVMQLLRGGLLGTACLLGPLGILLRTHRERVAALLGVLALFAALLSLILWSVPS
jgi:hypothetical protein